MTLEKNNANSKDLITAFLIAAIFSVIGTKIAFYLGFFIVFLGLFLAAGIVEAVRAVIQSWHSPQVFWAIVIAIILGGIPVAVLAYLDNYRYAALFQAAFVFFTALAAYMRISDFQLKFE